MTRIGKSLSLMALVFLPALSQGAPEVRVNGLVDSNQVSVGQPFRFTVEVASSEAVNAEDPLVPALDGLRVINMATSTSTSTKMVQGPRGWEFNSERRLSFVFTMIPSRKGKLTIPPFTVTVEGSAYKTKPVKLRAVEGGSLAQPRRQRPGGGFPPGLPDIDDLLDDPDELYQALLQRRLGPGGGGGQPSQIQPPKNPNELLSIQCEVDKREVFEGEQITVNWYILVKGNLLSLDRTKFPDLKGFWKEIIEEVPALQFSQEVINGQVYRRALLASHALFPIKEGTAVIDEFKIKGQVQSGSPFGGFGGRPYTFQRSSERIPIKVLPIPKEGRPPDFTGAVGDFTVQANVENNILPLNQPFILRIRFEGRGNAKLIDLPAIQWPPSLEVYETKQESRFFKNGTSFKQFEVMLIPRQTGDIETPAISVSLFDPGKKQFYTRTIEPVTLKILPGSDPAVLAAHRLDSKTMASPDAALQLPNPIAVLPERTTTISTPLLLGGLYLGVFALLGLVGYRELWRKQTKKDLRLVLRERTRQAEAFAAKGDYRKTGVIMVNLISEILGEISGQAGSDREIEKMLELCPPSVRRNLGADLTRLTESFQTLSFAPETFVNPMKDRKNLEKLIGETRVVLEKALADQTAEQA